MLIKKTKTIILSTIRKPITITYIVMGDKLSVSETDKINSLRFNNRIKSIFSIGYSLHYLGYPNLDLKNSLMMIDSLLPDMLAEVVKYHYQHNVVSMTNALTRLIEENPINYNQSLGHNFYERKMKSFLSSLVLGFANAPYNATNINCKATDKLGSSLYNPYYPNQFEEYLLNSAKLVTPRLNNQRLGYIFSENGGLLMTLCAEIQFS